MREEAEFIAKEREAVSTFIRNERDQLREEKENLHNQYNQDLGFLASEREKFMNKMAHEHAEWFGKMQQERADFLREIELQKQELNNLIEKRREEVESSLKEREKAFEEEKNTELQYINALKEKATKELEQVSLEMKRLLSATLLFFHQAAPNQLQTLPSQFSAYLPQPKAPTSEILQGQSLPLVSLPKLTSHPFHFSWLPVSPFPYQLVLFYLPMIPKTSAHLVLPVQHDLSPSAKALYLTQSPSQQHSTFDLFLQEHLTGPSDPSPSHNPC